MQTSFIIHGHEKISLDRKEINGVRGEPSRLLVISGIFRHKEKTLFLIPLINHHSRKSWGIKNH